MSEDYEINEENLDASNEELTQNSNMSEEEFKEIIQEADKKIQISDKLSEEEREKIESSKKKRGPKKKEKEDPPKKTVDEELKYDRQDLSEEELKISEELQESLVTFITDKADMSPGTGVKYLLPTGIDLLDAVAGGGFAAGALTVLVGNPGTFKSALLAQTIAANQRKYRGKVLNMYLDSEEAMTTKRLEDLGVRYPRIKPYPAITIERLFKAIEGIATFKDINNMVDSPSILALDSLANTITEKEKESTDMDPSKYIGLKARVISTLLPKYLTKLHEYNIGLIVVNQLREKIDIGVFKTQNDLRWIGDKTMPGGNAMKYNAFHLLLLKIKSDLDENMYGFKGVKLQAKFVKNKLFQPNIEISLIVDFNKGVSNFWTNYNMLVDSKRLKSGAWNSLVALPEIKFRTKDAYDKYKNEEEFRKVFDQQVNDCLKTEYIDPYV